MRHSSTIALFEDDLGLGDSLRQRICTPRVNYLSLVNQLVKIPATVLSKYGRESIVVGVSIFVQRPSAAEDAEGGGEYGKAVGKAEVPRFVVISSASLGKCYRGSDVRLTTSSKEVSGMISHRKNSIHARVGMQRLGYVMEDNVGEDSQARHELDRVLCSGSVGLD